MKKHVFMIAAAVLLGTMSFAQSAGPRGGAPGAGGQAKPGQAKGGMMRAQGLMQIEAKVFGQLGLNATQKTKVAALQKGRADKMKALRDKYAGDRKPGQSGIKTGPSPDRTKAMAEFKKLSDDYQAGLKATLTAAQYKKYQDLLKVEMEKWQKDHPRGAGGAAGAGGKTGKGGGGA